MSTPSLSPMPWIIFGIVEPLFLLLGTHAAITTPQWYIAELVPQQIPVASLPNHITAMHMLGVCYGLIAALLVIIFNVSSDRKLIKAILAVFALADIGIAGSAALGLGDNMAQPDLWNQMAWGNIGFSGFLFAIRILTLLGVFDRSIATTSKAKKSN